MYIPAVGSRVKLRTLSDYYQLGVTPNWQWLRVDSVSGELASVTVLDGDTPTMCGGPVSLDRIAPPLGWRERKPGEYLFEIPPEKVEMVRDWFKNRGGVLRWTNKDLGNCGAPDKITPALPEPGETKQAPGWAYVGEAFPVTPEDIGVRTETHVPIDAPIRVAVRKKPWIGYDLTDTGKAKARKTAAKLGPDVKWDFEHVGYGLAHLRFYREKIEPFTKE